MNDNKSIDEIYEDALFVKLMDGHAQIEGARLLKENEQLKNDANFHLPDKLDRRCMDTINKVYKARKREQIRKTTFTVLKRVAVFVLICSVLFTGLWCSASAFREAVFRLFTNDHIDNKDIQIRDSSEDTISNKMSGQMDELPEGVTLPSWLPQEYVLSSFTLDGTQLNATYINDLGNQILYTELPDGFIAGIDTEDADKTENVLVNGYEGVLVSKGKKISVSWGDTDNNKLIRISSETISKEEILRMANSIIK